MTVSGSTVNVGTGGAFTATSSMVVGNNTTAAAVNVTGGTVTVTGEVTTGVLVLANNAGAGSAVFTLTSGAVTNNAISGGLRFGVVGANTSSSTFHLDGGILTVARIFEGDASHTSTLNLNGGTIKTRAGTTTAATFMAGIDTVNVRNGGVIFDTNAVDTTVGQALAHSIIGLDNAIDGGLTKNVGSGILTLSGANTYTGATTISVGTLKAGVASVANVSGAFGKNSAVTLANVSGAIMDITGFDTQIGSLTGGGATGGNVTLGAATLTVGGDNTSPAAYAGVISGSTGKLTKIGSGTLTLSGANTYTGATTVSRGTLRYGVASALSSSSDVIFDTASGTATLDLNNLNGTIKSLTLGGASATVAAVTTGTGILTLGGDVTYNAANNPNGATITGLLNLGAATRTFEIQDSTATVEELLVSATISGSGGLTKTSDGAMTLNGLNSFTGLVAVREGILSVNTLEDGSTDSSLGAGTGAVQLGYGTRTGVLQYTGAATSTNRQIQLGHSNATHVGGGVIQNNGSGALTYSNGDFNAPVASVSVARNLTLGGTNTDLNTISGKIVDNDTGGIVSLTKADAGTWVLAGANTYTGTTTINGGTLLVTDTIGSSAVTINNSGTVLASDTAATIGSTLAVNNGAILAVGGAANATTATATVVGASTFNNGSIFAWDINSDGTSYDKLITSSLAGGSANFVIVAADSSFGDTFWDTNQSWNNIFTTDGSAAISGWASLFSMSVVNSSFVGITPVGGSFSISGNTLAWTAVPEPTSALAGLLITAGLLRRRRTV